MLTRYNRLPQKSPAIRCLPKGVCSWDFFIEGDDILADVALSTWKESGAIVLNGEQFEIRKDGLLSGSWTLSQGGNKIASATKLSVLKRSFDITKGMDFWHLRAESALGRRFLMIRSYEEIGRITPMHAFTRRATIEMNTEEYDTQLLAFSFWLTILMWRRAASSS